MFSQKETSLLVKVSMSSLEYETQILKYEKEKNTNLSFFYLFFATHKYLSLLLDVDFSNICLEVLTMVEMLLHVDPTAEWTPSGNIQKWSTQSKKVFYVMIKRSRDPCFTPNSRRYFQFVDTAPLNNANNAVLLQLFRTRTIEDLRFIPKKQNGYFCFVLNSNFLNSVLSNQVFLVYQKFPSPFLRDKCILRNFEKWKQYRTMFQESLLPTLSTTKHLDLHLCTQILAFLSTTESRSKSAKDWLHNNGILLPFIDLRLQIERSHFI